MNKFRTERAHKIEKVGRKTFKGNIKDKPNPSRFPSKIETLFCRTNLFVRSTMLFDLLNNSSIALLEMALQFNEISFIIFAHVAIIRK